MTRRARPATRFRRPNRTQIHHKKRVYAPGHVVMQGMDFYRVAADGSFVKVEA